MTGSLTIRKHAPLLGDNIKERHLCAEIADLCRALQLAIQYKDERGEWGFCKGIERKSGELAALMDAQNPEWRRLAA